MTDNATTGTALALPEPTALAAMMRADRGLDPILERIEAEATAERDRIARENAAAEAARQKRAADEAHRAKIRADIAAALATMAGRATPEAIADALMAGQIPHCEVRL